jgi:phosphoglycerate dehydrogenase-like enzyme
LSSLETLETSSRRFQFGKKFKRTLSMNDKKKTAIGLSLRSREKNMDTDKKITIIGCGRLGLCLALCFDRAKYNVLAVDIFPDYVKALNSRTFRSKEPRVDEFLQVLTH